MAMPSSTSGPLGKTCFRVVLPCVLSLAACGAAAVPAQAPAATSLYLFLHQTRFDGGSSETNARLATCYAPGSHAAQRRDAKGE